MKRLGFHFQESASVPFLRRLKSFTNTTQLTPLFKKALGVPFSEKFYELLRLRKSHTFNKRNICVMAVYLCAESENRDSNDYHMADSRAIRNEIFIGEKFTSTVTLVR